MQHTNARSNWTSLPTVAGAGAATATASGKQFGQFFMHIPKSGSMNAFKTLSRLLFSTPEWKYYLSKQQQHFRPCDKRTDTIPEQLPGKSPGLRQKGTVYLVDVWITLLAGTGTGLCHSVQSPISHTVPVLSLFGITQVSQSGTQNAKVVGYIHGWRCLDCGQQWWYNHTTGTPEIILLLQSAEFSNAMDIWGTIFYSKRTTMPTVIIRKRRTIQPRQIII